MRSKTYLFSESVMPWMRAFAMLAPGVARDRHALADDHPGLLLERQWFAGIAAYWGASRRLRDAMVERLFAVRYES
jgi:hypothetical protein